MDLMRRSTTRWSRVIAVALLGLLSACTDPAPKPVVNYPALPPKEVPAFLKDTILSFTDLGGTEPFPVSGFALVANLNGNGGSRAPTSVRDYIVKEMARRGFGSVANNWETPEQILASKNFTIVRVDAAIPPGARAGTDWWTWTDVRAAVLPQSDATSLAHGDLYECDLKEGGANPMDPGGGRVKVMAQAKGPVFINPAYAIDDSNDTPRARSSRRVGVVLGGARVMDDRPLILRLRQPTQRMARAIQERAIEHFQDVVDDDLRHKGLHGIADARNEAEVYVYVPRAYGDNWQHFSNVLKHLYMQGGLPEFAAIKAQELADEAVKPDAPLGDISYCFEGLGKPALHAMTPLMSSNKPEVQFAAVRAAAFIGDPAAPPLLAQIAQTIGNPFRVTAVQVLGEIPQSPRTDKMLRQLLDSDQAMVRIEAYRVLAKHHDLSVYSRVVRSKTSEKFVLDIVQCAGAPLVYASRSGVPRLAIFGPTTSIDLPMFFSAMQDRFTISSNSDASVTLYYNALQVPKPIKAISSPELAEVVRWLGGEGAAAANHFDFSYSDIVAMVQSLADQQKLSISRADQRLVASFVLQESTIVEQVVQAAALMDDGSRPQGNSPGTAPTSAPVGTVDGASESPFLPALEPGRN